jgi:hypothetical protein
MVYVRRLTAARLQLERYVPFLQFVEKIENRLLTK